MPRFAATVATLLLLLAASTAPAAPNDEPLVWRGDVATARAFMHDLARAWRKAGNPAIKVEPFSTIAGIDAALDGSADLAGSARAPFAKRAQEADLAFTPLAWDALVIVVHEDNPMRNLSLSQLHDIYHGDIENWKDLGGPDHRIHLYSVASPLDGVEYSLRRYLFKRGNQPVASRRLYINTRQLEDAIALDPWGMGASTLSAVAGNKELKVLQVDGVTPSADSIADGSYPLYQPLYLVTPTTSPDLERINAFMAFAQGPAGKQVLQKRHLLPYDGLSALATGMDRHSSKVQAMSAPPLDGPLAAPGATYAARAAQAPISELTTQAQQRLQKTRQRQQASAEARASNAGGAPAAVPDEVDAAEPAPASTASSAPAEGDG